MKRLMIGTLFFALLAPGWANAGPPTRFLQEQVKAVRALIAQPVADKTPEKAARDEQLKAIIDPLMEFDQLSERALRKHWPALQPEQRARFTHLFRELVFHSYLEKVSSANEEYSVDYEDEEPKPNQGAAVSAVAKTKKAEIELVFHLAGRPAGKFVAEDIVIDEVSLVDNYREQFNKIIAKDGFGALIKKMEEKLVKLGANPNAPAAAPVAPPAPGATAVPPGTPGMEAAPKK